MASDSLSFVGDFCSGFKCVGVVDERIVVHSKSK